MIAQAAARRLSVETVHGEKRSRSAPWRPAHTNLTPAHCGDHPLKSDWPRPGCPSSIAKSIKKEKCAVGHEAGVYDSATP